jgi:serine/threonine protein kinase
VPHYGEQEFRGEVKAILKVKPRPHLEVGLLTSFEHRDRFHLLFRWADGGNLRDLWMNNPRPSLTHSRMTWMAQQLYGLAHGLDGIHNTKLESSETFQISPSSPVTTQQSFDIVCTQVHEPDEGRDYGRHGDIKPQNVLWFRKDTKNPEFGILKLSDFGLTTFHRALTTGVQTEGVRVTNTYAAPEREIEETLSRPFDVWSLGCIFLEFATWMILGPKGITKFEQEREPDGGHRSPNFQLDNFFTVFRDGDKKYRAAVKPSVSNVSGALSDHMSKTESDYVVPVDCRLEKSIAVQPVSTRAPRLRSKQDVAGSKRSSRHFPGCQRTPQGNAREVQKR